MYPKQYLKLLIWISKGLYISFPRKSVIGMGFMRRLNLFAVLVLVSCAVAYADFTVSYEPVKDKIFLNETAVVELHVTNDMARDADFLIYPGAVEWSVTTIPPGARQKTIDAGATANITLGIEASTDFWPNIYGVPVRVKNLATNEVKTEEVLLEVKGEGGQLAGEYLPAIQVSFEMDEEIDPRDDFNIKVVLKNQNRLNISKLGIVIESGLVSREYETSLDALESKSLDFTIPLDPYLKPQSDLVNVKARVSHKEREYEFYARSKEVRVIQYGQISEEIDEHRQFLKKTNVVKLTNTGNVVREYQYRIKKRLYSPLFIDTKPQPVVQEYNGVTYYVWRGELEPREAHSVTVVLSYRWVAAVVTILVLAWLSYYIFRSPIIVTKTARAVAKAEGGVSVLNIQLHIKNRSARRFHSLEIRDKVPNLLIVQSEFNIGTLQPSNVLKHSKRGTIMKWNIDDFDPFEERIITYKASAKLPILGEFSLPRAVVKFKKSVAGEYRYAHSNMFRMDYSLKEEV